MQVSCIETTRKSRRIICFLLLHVRQPSGNSSTFCLCRRDLFRCLVRQKCIVQRLSVVSMQLSEQGLYERSCLCFNGRRGHGPRQLLRGEGTVVPLPHTPLRQRLLQLQLVRSIECAFSSSSWSRKAGCQHISAKPECFSCSITYHCEHQRHHRHSQLLQQLAPHGWRGSSASHQFHPLLSRFYLLDLTSLG